LKENPCSVVGEVSETTCIRFDKLNGAIEAFGASIADMVRAVVEQALLVVSEHFDDLLYRRELTTHCVVAPALKEAFGRSALVV
jgi:hypothetical protein